MSFKINLVSFRTFKRSPISQTNNWMRLFFLNHSILTALVLLLNTYHDNTENNTSNDIVGSVLHEFVFKFFKASYYFESLISGIFSTLVHFIIELFTTRYSKRERSQRRIPMDDIQYCFCFQFAEEIVVC